MASVVFESNMPKLNLVKRGKVREIYEFADAYLLVATDRISAFDVIMNEPIPSKGQILSSISKFWFEKTKHIIPNHIISTEVEQYPTECMEYKSQLEGRSMLVKKCRVLPVQFIVRGYVAGSGWKEYKSNGTICGNKLPDGLQEYEKLPEAIFTPSTKEDEGHDINISYDRMVEILGAELSEKLRKISIELYNFAHEYLFKNGIIIADTKFEFGVLENGEVILIDEALTPDSSRFWLKENYAPGKEQMNFDKQVLRDWLETIDWDKTPPPPTVPQEIIDKTVEKYLSAQDRILNGRE